MHWPNLWHFCMFLGFSSSWRGKQRRYLRYSVGNSLNLVLYFQNKLMNLFSEVLQEQRHTFKSNYSQIIIILYYIL